MKTLLLMRHAKSDWGADYGVDHDRPLNERGKKSAQTMGRVIAEHGLAPEIVITSTAVRAHTTAILANEAGHWGAEIILEPDLYGGAMDTAIHVASRAGDVDHLMLVGHQPTWSILAQALTGERVDMRTATVAVIEFDIDDWADLESSSRGLLTAVYQPRDHMEGEEDEP